MRSGFVYEEVDSLTDLAEVVIGLVMDWPANASVQKQNVLASAEFFKSEKLAQNWVDVYRSFTKD